MKYEYTEKDLDLISWERIDQFIEKIYQEVKQYLEEAHLSIRYIAPIMRGGGVPAIKFSHLFDVVDMLPIQLKHNSETNAIDKIMCKIQTCKRMNVFCWWKAIMLQEEQRI